jgi:hypothetical protein
MEAWGWILLATLVAIFWAVVFPVLRRWSKDRKQR